MSVKKRLFGSLAAVMAVIICFTVAGGATAASAATKSSKSKTVTEEAADSKDSKKKAAENTLSGTEIFKKCSPACVEIKITDSCGAVYIGSGFFVGKYNVLTNQHVIENASKIEVLAIDGTAYTLKSIYGIDEEKDLALLRVKEKNDAYLKISGTHSEVGDVVYSIGNPVGVVGTMIRGMVSFEERKTKTQSFVQLDIPSGKGIGGAPVINGQGKVVGVMCLTVPTGNNINLAISADDVNAFLKGLTKKDRMSLKKYYESQKDGIVTPNAINLIEDTSFEYTSDVYDGVYEVLSPQQIYKECVEGLTQVFALDPLTGGYTTGTGFFVRSDIVVTNEHVVSVRNPILLGVYDYVGNEYKVTEVYVNPDNTDVAVLKVELVKQTEGQEDFKPTILHIESEYIPASGEEVYAIGNPQGYLYTMSSGIISIPMVHLDRADHLVHSAPTSLGSSGGILVNKYGEVIGITNMLVNVCENMCFSIMIKYAENLIKQATA